MANVRSVIMAREDINNAAPLREQGTEKVKIRKEESWERATATTVHVQKVQYDDDGENDYDMS